MNYATNISVVLLALLLAFSGCAQNGDENEEEGSSGITADIEGGKTFMFYNHGTQDQYVFDSEHKENSNLNSDATSNFYMKDKESGRLLFWPDEYEEGEVDEKVVMLKASYDFERDGNITADDFFYLGHFHDDELAAHSADEFTDANINDAKRAALVRLNIYLAHQVDVKKEIEEALSAEGEQLCNFLVPHHEEHDDNESDDNETEHAHEETPHYAISKSGKVFVFEEGESGLVKEQGDLVLDGVYECNSDESGMTVTADGFVVFSKLTQKIYLVDAHGLDFHVHSSWPISDILPSSVQMTQMIGFGGSEEEHDHDEEY